MKKEKVESIIQKLSNLRALACSSSIEDFVLSYLTILDSNPNTQPVIVERICNARQDIKRQVCIGEPGTCSPLSLREEPQPGINVSDDLLCIASVRVDLFYVLYWACSKEESTLFLRPLISLL